MFFIIIFLLSIAKKHARSTIPPPKSNISHSYIPTADCSLAQRHYSVIKLNIFLRSNVNCLAWISLALWLQCIEDLSWFD